jgi:hypothetical protein
MEKFITWQKLREKMQQRKKFNAQIKLSFKRINETLLKERANKPIDDNRRKERECKLTLLFLKLFITIL